MEKRGEGMKQEGFGQAGEWELAGSSTTSSAASGLGQALGLIQAGDEVGCSDYDYEDDYC